MQSCRDGLNSGDRCLRSSRFFRSGTSIAYLYNMTEHTSNYQALLKSIKANQQIALDYIKLSIPPDVLERFDLSSITQRPTTYVPEELEKSLSDIVYTCRNASGTDNVKISLLILHTSEVNKYAPIQIGSYMFSAMLKQAEKGKNPH